MPVTKRSTTFTLTVSTIAVLGAVLVTAPQPVQAVPAVDIVIVGGEGVVSPTVEAQLQTCTAGTVTRLSGTDRYQTAAAVSAATFPTSDTAYVATGTDFPDALAGAPVGAIKGSPLLLVHDSVPGVVWNELARLGVTSVVAFGGASAVSDSVLQSIGMTYPTSRLSGSNRFETAAAIVQNGFATADVVYIATGFNFPDALAGGAAAGSQNAPILLVNADSIPAPTANQLTRLKPSTIKILGGQAAVSTLVEQKLASYADTVTRLSGNNRYETAANISKDTFTPGVTTVYIATGLDYPDALGAGPAAGFNDAPILLTLPDTLPNPTKNELQRLTGVKCQDISKPTGNLTVQFVAVRQGDAALYKGPCGEIGLIDANRFRDGEILAAMDSLGSRNLKWISVSHYDADHLGAIVDVATAPGVSVGAVYDRGGNRTVKDSNTYREYYDWVTGAGIRQPVDIGNTFTLCSGADQVTFNVLSVGTDGTAAGGITVSDENDRGVCLKVDFAEFDLATCGDVSGTNAGSRSDVESAVAGSIRDVEVAKVNHHGSTFSSNATYLSTLKAQVSVISVGKNGFAHPAASVVSAWDVYGDVYQTQSSTDNAMVDGDVVVTTNGTTGFVVVTSQGGGGTYPLD